MSARSKRFCAGDQVTHKITKKLVSAADAALFVLVEVVSFVDELVEVNVAVAVVEADTVAGVDEALADVAVPGTHWSVVIKEQLAPQPRVNSLGIPRTVICILGLAVRSRCTSTR